MDNITHESKIKLEDLRALLKCRDLLKEIMGICDGPWDTIIIDEELYNKIKEVLKS